MPSRSSNRALDDFGLCHFSFVLFVLLEYPLPLYTFMD